MSQLPVCPNFRQRLCERNELRLAGENDHAFIFHCLCCTLTWAVSKDKSKAKGRYEAEMRRVKELSEQERIRSGMRKYSFAGGR